MMLSAIVLLVGFLALAGMVARVNQLGTQTGTEARHAVLDEAGPLKRSIDNGLARLANRTLSSCCTWAAGLTLTSSTDVFSASDVGLRVTGGNIPAGSKITAVANARSASVSQALAAQGSATTINIWRPGFALTTATRPTAEAAAVSMLEQIQLSEAGHGLWMDWQIGCVGNDPAKGQVIADLSDATVWVEMPSTVTFARADCTVVRG